MEQPLVVGVDGSDASLDAVDWAAGAAKRYDCPLRIVYASRWERYEGGLPNGSTEPSAERLMEERILGAAAERAARRAPGIKASTHLVPEDPTTALLAEARHATAVVVGHRGRGRLTSLLLGSVGLVVAGRARCPVVVVRGHPPLLHGPKHTLVLGIGEETTGAAAVAFALRAAEARKYEVEAVHAWRCGIGEAPGHHAPHSECRAEHEQRAQQLFDEALNAQLAGYPGVSVVRRTVEGAAGASLVMASDTADLLVVGARRRAGHAGLELGPVNHTVLHHARCPVAVVPER
ncbi:universal stress protein [Streptomyces sp. Ru73]|uniref:universal stress protein n=1 Tax=Streptomyces sp. Ru73 TaxID=2080748 RepID=UPI000CDD9EE8|nr:universal stress protein [Streptomyces sp. Ru73]POX36663.1 universal stress protein [Streptomyces sp. Ru73]